MCDSVFQAFGIEKLPAVAESRNFPLTIGAGPSFCHLCQLPFCITPFSRRAEVGEVVHTLSFSSMNYK